MPKKPEKCCWKWQESWFAQIDQMKLGLQEGRISEHRPTLQQRAKTKY